MGIIVLAGLGLLACENSVTGPQNPTSQGIPVVDGPGTPQLAESNSNCAVWACSLANVPNGYDPVTQGAFCMAITEEGVAGAPKPESCESGWMPTCTVWVGDNCTGSAGNYTCEAIHLEPC